MEINLPQIALLVTAVGSLIAALIALAKVRTEKKKLGADAASVLSASAIGLLEPMSKEVDRLEERLERANQEITKCTSQIEVLKRKNEELLATNHKLQRSNLELQDQVRRLLDEVRVYRRSQIYMEPKVEDNDNES